VGRAADAVVSVAVGSCAGFGAQQVNCGDEEQIGGQPADAVVEESLNQGDIVTVYAAEYCEIVDEDLNLPGGGSGTLSIELL
jgi:hypothetical protein